MKRTHLLLLCLVAMIAICLASCSQLPEIPGGSNLPGCVELFGSHTIEHVEAKDATCTADGNIEYWTCKGCGSVWTDSALKNQIDKKDTVLPQLEHEYMFGCDAHCMHCGEFTNGNAAHTIEHVAAKDATCAAPGNVEYWYCTDCGTAWTDADCTQLTNLMSIVVPQLACPVVHIEAVEPGCHYEGNIEYWICYDCERVWQDEALTQLTNVKNVILPATGHTDVVHFDAVAPACHYTGNVEYWFCKNCEQVWTDAALTELTNIKSVVLPATGGEVNHVNAVAANCHQNGNIEYWYCDKCEQVWQDAALTQLTNFKSVITGYKAEIVHVEAVEAVCHQTGNVEYWYCSDCLAVFTDAALTQLSNFKSVTTPAVTELTYVPAVEASCHQNGSQEYWYCADCGAVFADAAGRYLTNVKNLTVPYTAEITHVEAVAPTCHQNGNVEYWYCSDCLAVFTDAALTQLSNFKNVVDPATVGLTYVPEVEATCHQNGTQEYWYCEECEAVFADAQGIYLTNVKNLTLVYTAEIKYVKAVAPTCTATGNVEYWYCADCNAVFTDAALIHLSNFKSVILPELGHTLAYECDKKCSVCFETVNPNATHKSVLVSAVASTCTKNGNTAHYTCEYCGNLWDDKALTKSISKNEVTLPLLPHAYRYECDAWCMNCYELTNESAAHNIVFVPAKDPTCISFGNIEHYSCTYCAACWDNADGFGMPLNQMMVRIAKVACEPLDPCYPECKWCFNPIEGATGHQVVHVAAKDKTCLEAGCIEHWYCSVCQLTWKDEALTQPIRKAEAMIPTKGEHTYIYECDSVCSVCQTMSRPENTHEYFYDCDKVCMYCYEETNPNATHDIAHVDALEAGCHQDGNIEYWYCTDCGIAWADETFRYQTNLKSVVIPATVGLTYVAEVAPTCHQNGCQEYWYCSECQAVFADAQGIYLTNVKNLTLVYTAEIVHVDAVEAGCHQNGNVEFWYCSDCDAVFTDAALTKLSNRKSVVTPYTAEIGHVDAVEAACHQTGNVEFWFCTECDAVFTDAALTKISNRKSVVTPCTAEIKHVEAVEAVDCQTMGNVEHWYCAECNAVFTDAALTQLSNFKSVKLGYGPHLYFYECDPVCMVCYEITNPEAYHSLTHVAAKAPTCTELGNVEYWSCTYCGSCWDNANATGMPLNMMSVKLPTTGHSYVKGLCSTCGAINYGTLENPVSVSDALNACGSLAEGKASADLFYVTGIVKKIGSTGSYYKNVYISDGTNEILIYSISMGEGVNGFEVGNLIVAYGYIKNYYGTIEMATNNGKYVYAISAVDPCADGHHYLDATCQAPKTCKYCGATEGNALEHVYVNGVCSACGAEKGVTTTTVKAAYTGGTTTNMIGDGSNEAGTFGLDTSVFNVTTNKCAPTNIIGLNKSGDFRLYHDSNAQNGSEFVVTVANGYVIDSITIKFTSTSYAANIKISANGTVITTTDGSSATVTVDVDASSFVLKNVGTKQNRIASIEIVYSTVA